MPTPTQRKQPTWILAFIPTVFLSAFLIFQIQPMISKHILPWYGGTPTVWTTCLVFFQALLFAGYAYAHLSVSRLRIHWQVTLQLALLVAAAFVSILPADTWKPEGSESPILRIVLMLLTTVGLPFFILSSSGPLLQAWFARKYPGRSPYYLYAISNGGSLLALITYPFLVEPALSVAQQAGIWSWAFVVLIVLCALIGASVWKTLPLALPLSGDSPATAGGNKHSDGGPIEEGGGPANGAPGALRQAMWIAWPACAVILFMAVTNQLTLNVAAVPFLWVMPLSIYLLSFIFAFNGPRWYPRRLYAVLLLAAFVAFYALFPGQIRARDAIVDIGLIQMILIWAVALFVCCMVCHGELYRIKPAPAYLTRYYLSISFGGVMGGLSVGVVAPHVFLLFQELQLGLILCCILFFITLFNDPRSALHRGHVRWAWAAMLAGFLVLAGASYVLAERQLKNTLITKRNFFGLLRVKEEVHGPSRTRLLRMFHGSILHGVQFDSPQLRKVPTAYFGRETGVGVLMTNYQRSGGRRIGVVGLGIATLAAYGQESDYFRFYEINPDMIKTARSHFHYLEDSRAVCDVVLGDGRLKLEEEPSQQFDILILDAFSSDAVPVHLLTLEAMEAYMRHLKPDGVMVFNVSNRFLDVSRVVYSLAAAKEFHALRIMNFRRKGLVSANADWVILSRNSRFMQEYVNTCKPLQESGLIRLLVWSPKEHELVLWTDDFSSIFQVLLSRTRRLSSGPEG
jgi:SAM-dependent methyltransferase